MLTLILVTLALVFGLLALFRVPERFSYAGAGVVCLAVAAMLGRLHISMS